MDCGLTKLTTARAQGKPPPSPHIIFCAPLRDTYIRMAFYPGTPKEESETATFWTPATLQDYNSFLRPSSGMMFEAKL